jgi:hypothetical protein
VPGVEFPTAPTCSAAPTPTPNVLTR